VVDVFMVRRTVVVLIKVLIVAFGVIAGIVVMGIAGQCGVWGCSVVIGVVGMG